MCRVRRGSGFKANYEEGQSIRRLRIHDVDRAFRNSWTNCPHGVNVEKPSGRCIN